MKKYPKMTFTALSAIALNFSCLATSQPPRHHVNNEMNTLNNLHQLRNINYRPPDPTALSTSQQISLLKRAIAASNVPIAELILKGCIGKRGRQYYYAQREGRFAVIKSEQLFEELQIFSLYDLRNQRYSTNAAANATKIKIFELITSKFFEVAKNKEYAYQTTASKIYLNLDILKFEFGALVDLFPSDDSKREFVRQLLNYAKQENNIKENIKKSGDVFWALRNAYFIKNAPISSFSIFENQPWLLQFIREYLKQALRDDVKNSDIPIDFIKKADPGFYYTKYITFIEKGIVEIDKDSIDLLLPLDENNLPCNAYRLSSKYLDLALNCLTCMNRNEYNEEDFPNDMSKDIFYSVALYTDTSDLTDVALILTNFHPKKRQRALEIIRDVNSVLHDLLLKEIQRLKAMNFQPNRVAGLNINEVQDHLLSTEEQISLLKSAILASKKTLVEKILNGYIGKIDSKYYYLSREESRQEDFFKPMSDEQFEELQLFSLNDLKHMNHCEQSLEETKQEIFKLITSKFYEVTNNKEQAYQTTASKMYSYPHSFGADELGKLIDLIPSDDGKRAFARQLLNDAKRNNIIVYDYEFIFFSLGEISEINIFTNQPWLLQFISEYLDQALSGTTYINLAVIPMDLKKYIAPDIAPDDLYNEKFPVYTDINYMPIDFIKEVAPDLYNEKFPTFLKKCITDDATDIIEALLPIDDRNNKYILLENRRLSAEYLNLVALEKYHSGKILSFVASYTDPSSDLTNVALTLAKFTQEECQETLKCIKDANINLYNPLLEKLIQCLGN